MLSTPHLQEIIQNLPAKEKKALRKTSKAFYNFFDIPSSFFQWAKKEAPIIQQLEKEAFFFSPTSQQLKRKALENSSLLSRIKDILNSLEKKLNKEKAYNPLLDINHIYKNYQI